MAGVRIKITNELGVATHRVELPSDVPIGKLLKILPTRIGRPSLDDRGAPIGYRLYDQGKELDPDQTLPQAGVQDEDALSLFAEARIDKLTDMVYAPTVVGGSGRTLAEARRSSEWLGLHIGQRREYELWMQIGPERVCLRCALLRVNASDAGGRLYKYLLRLNEGLALAKFTLFHSGGEFHSGTATPPQDWIALVVECPVGVFDATMLKTMMNTITDYAEEYDAELAATAARLGHQGS